MTEELEIYQCPTCGNIVQILIPGTGEPVCCGQAMNKLEAQFQKNELGEKHVPDIIKAWDGCDSGVCNERKFVVLDKHPMTSEHYIQFIEVCDKEKTEVRIKFFNPNEKAEYEISDLPDNVTAIELCNIHGLWKDKE